MNKNEKYSIRKYDSLAQKYDNTFDGRFTAKFKEKMLEVITVSDGDMVLDVGCGNGSLINAINHKAEIQAHGIDVSPNMIEVCRQRYGNIDFEISNGEDLYFGNGNLDMLTICCVLHHLNKPQKFFKETQRVLKTGGTLIVGEPWLPFGLRQLTNWIVSPLIKAGDNKLFSHKKLKRFFIDNGFAITGIYKKGIKQIIKARKL